MGLQQIPKQQRIVFLRKFTASILFNLVEEEIRKKVIEVAKLRKKLAEPIEVPKKIYFPDEIPIKNKEDKQVISNPDPKNKIIPESPIKKIQQLSNQNIQVPKNIPQSKGFEKNPVFNKQINSINRAPKIQFNQPMAFSKTRKVYPSNSNGLGLSKLEKIIQDPYVQFIECKGPLKRIYVRKKNRIFLTDISLTQEDISKVIQTFSKKARIPIIGGILKAVVGDLVISAVISEFVGSRFIINRISKNQVNF